MTADGLGAALDGIDVAYYLIHSIGTGSRFADRDRAGAANFARAAAAAGVRRIVYLGGLADEHAPEVSEHLASRAEVARLLLDSDVPVIALRAAVILGSGSASFEMLRYLTERLPAMVTPSGSPPASSRSRSAMCCAIWWPPCPSRTA